MMKKYAVPVGKCCVCGQDSKTEVCGECLVKDDNAAMVEDGIVSPIDYIRPLAEENGLEVVVVVNE